MYGAQREHPRASFRPISTPLSRLTRRKLENSLRIENQRIYRPKSALITTKDDVKELSKHEIVLPSLSSKFYVAPTSARSEGRRLDQRSHMLLKDMSFACFHGNEDETIRKSRLRLRSAPPILIREHESSHGPSTEEVLSRTKQTLHWFSKYWSEKERAIALTEIVQLLNSKQLYHLAGLLSLTQYRDFIALLPKPLSVDILTYLSPKDVVAVQKVCRKWHKIGSSDEIWQAKCLESIINLTKDANTSWKELFVRNVILQSNRKKGKYESSRLLGHTEGVLCCAVEGRRLATGGLDKRIMLWDTRTGVPVMALLGHLRGIWCLSFHDRTLLVSGSHDSTIKIWNIRTGLCERTLLAHDGPVWCLAIRSATLVTGSHDKTMRLWNLRNCQCTKTLSEHTAPIFCVAFNEDGSQMFSGSADKTIRVWNPKKGICLRVLKASSTHSVMAVSYCSGLLASCANNVISLWDASSGVRIQTLIEHKQRIESLSLRIEKGRAGLWEGIIVSGGKDNLIKYWDIKKGECIKTLTGHKDEVSSVHFNGSVIVSTSHDKTVRLWNFKETEVSFRKRSAQAK
ncbi:F-box/WD repeat-containing protein 7-like isoform X2 [Oscarella lobularis]